jgi:hypothetical protein
MQKGLAPIYIILIILFVLGGGIGLYFFSSPSGKDQLINGSVVTQSTASSPPVTIALTSSKERYQVGDTIEIAVELNTEDKQTAGIDVMLSYDPAILKLKAVDETASTEPMRYLIIGESEFANFNYFRAEEGIGNIVFSALMRAQETFSGQTTVATLTFEAIKAGTEEIIFLFDLGSTKDTNVSYNGQDVLEKAESITLTIQ